MTGLFVSIHVAGEAEGLMSAVEPVRALPGKGLDGDRSSRGAGTFSTKSKLDQKVTVIEAEPPEAVARRDYGVTFNPGATRRNMVTRDGALNHLAGRDVAVGPVRLSGLLLSEPCKRLATLTMPERSNALVHRGGLRCQILSDGFRRVGDAISA